MPCNPLSIWAFSLSELAQGKPLEGEKGLKPENLCLFPHFLVRKKESTKARKMFTNGPITVMSSSPSLLYAC